MLPSTQVVCWAMIADFVGHSHAVWSQLEQMLLMEEFTGNIGRGNGYIRYLRRRSWYQNTIILYPYWRVFFIDAVVLSRTCDILVKRRSVLLQRFVLWYSCWTMVCTVYIFSYLAESNAWSVPSRTVAESFTVSREVLWGYCYVIGNVDTGNCINYLNVYWTSQVAWIEDLLSPRLCFNQRLAVVCKICWLWSLKKRPIWTSRSRLSAITCELVLYRRLHASMCRNMS